jgi:Zn-dependent protease
LANHQGFILELLIWALPTVFAIVAHEVMHGVTARFLGDDTAARAGRLTLNPIAHVDLFGTLLLPALLLFAHLPVFGYAKPVPVDFRRLRDPKRGMILVAAAGPLTNFAIAAFSAGAMRIFAAHLGGYFGATVFYPLALMAQASVVINVSLAVFNLLPLPPLDGGRVATGLLPLPAARRFARIERFGFLILLLLLYTNAVDDVINPIIHAITRALL